MSKIISRRAAIAAAMLAAAFVSNGAAVHAAEGARLGTVKPLDAISFDIGNKRAVGYFLAENGSCKLVLTVADNPNFNETESFAPSRFEAAIPAGKSTRYQGEGPAIDFACHSDALAMSATVVKRIASGSNGE